MEIPSSSPVYTPLKSEDADPQQNYGLEQIELFKDDINGAQSTQDYSSNSETCLPGDERSDPELNAGINTSSPQDSKFQITQENFDKRQSQITKPRRRRRRSSSTRSHKVNGGQIPSSEPETPYSRSPIRSNRFSQEHGNVHCNAGDPSNDARPSRAQTPSFDETQSSDNETTIYSDDDNDDNDDHKTDNENDDDETLFTQTQETSEGKHSTQNYLEEFLTESVLESLPLPPERKAALRELR